MRIVKSLACKVETVRFHKIFLFLVQDGPLLVLNGIMGSLKMAFSMGHWSYNPKIFGCGGKVVVFARPS